MSDPIVFTARSARMNLPFLFAAQAQKEATVNEALARIDSLLAPSVVGETAAPPASSADGECWIVGADALDAWAGHDGELAMFTGGTWMFAAPQPGMTVFDQAAAHFRRWIDGWQALALPVAPTGGATIDIEARAAIAALIDELRTSGMGT